MAFINIFSLFFRKIRLDVSCESSARQRIHMKNQALFSSEDKKFKMSSAAFFVWRFKQTEIASQLPEQA